MSSTALPGTTIGTVSLADARRIVAAAERKAEEIGVPMCIAVVDAGGNQVAAVRMDGAWIGSVDVAANKAFTARVFDAPTDKLWEVTQSGQPAFGLQFSNGCRVMAFEGGVPVQRGGRIVGAVGVSGGYKGQDGPVAEAGAAALDAGEPA